jgi:hypothetical protein
MQQMIQNAPILTSDGQRSDPDAVKDEIMKQYGVTNQQKLNELIRKASDAGRQQPAGIALTEKPAPEPAPGPRPAPGLEPADQCRQIGKVPPSEEDIQRLIAEHNQAGEHLTRAAAISDIENTKPDNTTVRIVGAGVKASDIIYEHCGQLMQPTVQVKAVKNQRGFNRGLTTELDHDMSSQVVAIQVPDHTTDAPYWQYRYWNSLRNPDHKNPIYDPTWGEIARPNRHREILIVNKSGVVPFRGPMYESRETDDPYGWARQ